MNENKISSFLPRSTSVIWNRIVINIIEHKSVEISLKELEPVPGVL